MPTAMTDFDRLNVREIISKLLRSIYSGREGHIRAEVLNILCEVLLSGLINRNSSQICVYLRNVADTTFESIDVRS